MDFVSVFPFDAIITSSNSSGGNVGRISKLGRMYKLVKLTRLIRVLKILKQRSNLYKYARDYLKISLGFERLMLFFMSFFLITHIFGCLWILMGTLAEDIDETWMSDYKEMTNINLYLTSVYFTITTITTVGFGDISGTNSLERIFCIFTMVAGVIAFSFASGSLASII